MALRDQPYLPLFIQDIMTDEKLNECSASTHGIYIKGIMCLMHKSDEYGKLLLKQNYKQTSDTSLNFGLQLTKHLPYSPQEIKIAIDELIRERVCFFEDDYLCQKRMIRDNDISESRSKAGKKGGGNPTFVKTKSQTKPQTNTEYEYENEYEIINNKKEQIKILCKDNFESVLTAFGKWRNYLLKQHEVVLQENEFTYDILLDAIKRIGADKLIEAIDYSIVSRFKKIYEQKDYPKKESKQDQTHPKKVNDAWSEKKKKLGIEG